MSEVPNCSFLEKPNDEGICKIDLKNPFLIIILVIVAVIGVIVLSAVVLRLARKPKPRVVAIVQPDTQFVTRPDTSSIIDSVSSRPMPGQAVRALRVAPPGTSSECIHQVGMPPVAYTPDLTSRQGYIAIPIDHTVPPPPPLEIPQYPQTPFLSRGRTGMTLAGLTYVEPEPVTLNETLLREYEQADAAGIDAKNALVASSGIPEATLMRRLQAARRARADEN